MLHGKYQGRNRFRVNAHARTEEVAGDGRDVARTRRRRASPRRRSPRSSRAPRRARRRRSSRCPARLRAREGLPDRPAALAAVHFGRARGRPPAAGLRRAAARPAAFWRLRARRRADRRAAPRPSPATLTARWLRDQLPFTPTGDQRAAMDEVDADLARAHPMQRLLMGEVGSGKTVVALYAMLRAVEHGMQAALMAPTETLAEQHFATLAGAHAGRARAGRAAHRARRPRRAAPTSSASSPAASWRWSSAPTR